MLVEQFQQSRVTAWKTLESLLRQRDLTTEERFNQFVRLYRSVTSDLSYAQTYYPDHSVTDYLNNLVSAAHHRLYRRSGRSDVTIWTFYCRIFPITFRQLSKYILVATVISLVGALYGYGLVLLEPVQAYHLLPPSFIHQVNPNQAGPHSVDAPVLSSTIMTHNILVALMAFVGGMTCGLYTGFALWQNGLILGVLAAIFQSKRNTAIFWSLIVPHGVTELLAIFIAGGAGLYIAHKILAPGSLRRSAALRTGAIAAVRLLLGTVPMFMIAGTIEGFITPSNLPVWTKFLVAVLTGLFWLAYFSLMGASRVARD
jgi:uncharacterized membrane protein SpoIIM required for sporulation